jgi:hypothetical protein
MPWESPGYGNIFFAAIIAVCAASAFWIIERISIIHRSRHLSLLRRLRTNSDHFWPNREPLSDAEHRVAHGSLALPHK